MGLYDHWPYTNFHELNLSWLLRKMRELSEEVREFVSLNTIKYADPIQWDITTQYEKNTLVIDPITGTAYLSLQPVPSGVSIYNTDYWTEVFSLERFITGANSNFTSKIDNETLTATFNSNVGEWIIWNDLLYTVIAPITAGDAYVVDSNITRTTIYAMYLSLLTSISDEVSNRITKDKTLASIFTSRADYDTSTATFYTPDGGWLIWNYKLYTATAPINVGDAYVEGTNITPVSIEGVWAALLGQISSLDSRVDNLEMNNVIMMGDSYALGVTNGGQDPNITSWCEYLRSMLGKTEDQVFIRGQDSGAFAASADILRFAKIIEAEEANIAAKFSPSTVSHIIVCAGANEILYNYPAVMNGVIDFCNYCRTKYPNAKVYIGMIGYGGQGIINGLNTLHSYHDISLCGYIDGAESCRNAVYLNGIENAHKKYFRAYHTNSDWVHPNAVGYLSLAQQIAQAIRSGYCDVRSVQEVVNLTPPSGVSVSANRLYTYIDNDITRLVSTGQIVVSGLNISSYVANGTVAIDLGTMESGAIIGRAENTSWSVPCWYYDSSNVLHTAEANLYADLNHLYIAITETNSAAWAATSISSIYIAPFRFETITTMC